MHVVATAGHVDHGKSTLIRALTGMEPDRWAEERRRGMTIDLGFAWTELPGDSGDRAVAFVDVPGHERFVSTMLAGIGPVPAVMFVVAADEGWMPQSTEHLDALAALGTRHGLLVVTRSDLMEPELALEEAREHLAGSPLAKLPSVCVSGATGAGMGQLRTALRELVDRLPTPDPEADPRLWVDRAFTIRGAGTVVTGTLPNGRLTVNDELQLEPGGRRVTVRALQSLGAPITCAQGVSRVAVNLRGVSREDVRRGDALVTPGRWLATSTVDVRLNAASRPGWSWTGGAAGLTSRILTLHVGAAAVPARVRPLGPDTARLTMSTALPLRIGDRALLRDPGQHRIVAGVMVLDVRPPPLRRRGASRQRAEQLATMHGHADMRAEVARRGLVRADELAAMGVGLPGSSADDSAQPEGPGTKAPGPKAPGPQAPEPKAPEPKAPGPKAPGAEAPGGSQRGSRGGGVHLRPRGADDGERGGAVLAAGGWLLAPTRAAELAEQLVRGVARHDKSAPLDTGLPPATAAQLLALPDPRLVELVLTMPPAVDKLVLRDGRVRRRDESRELPAALRAAMDVLREELRARPFAAPEAGRLDELGLGPKELAGLVRAGELSRIAPGIYLLPGAEQRAVTALTQLGQPEFTLSTARQALDTTRRVAVPLLELLARRGYTSRTPQGNHRLNRAT